MTVSFIDGKNLPNLDCLADAESTARVAQALKYASDQLRILSHYAEVKSKAMVARESGKIDQTLKLEQELDAIYNCIDNEIKW